MTNTEDEKVERSFNDFVLLRKALVHNFPGWYIPKIPEKRVGIDKSTDEKGESNELKRIQLEDFIAKLGTVSHLSSSDIYKSFTKSKANVNKTLKRYMNPSKKDILERYKDVFFNLNDKEINGELLYKIEKFDELLKERLPILRKFKTVIRKNIDGFRQSRSQISEFMSSLGKYEEIYLDYSKDVNHLTNQSEGDTFYENYKSWFGVFRELQKDQYCPYYELDSFVNNDIADYEAFLEAIKTQKSYISNRRSIRYQLDKLLEQFNALDFSSTKDDRVRKMQQKLEVLEIEFNEIDLLWNIMLVAMGYYEMERFQIEKYRLYCEAISQFSKKEIGNQTEILGFYQYLKNLSNISFKN